MTHNQNDTFLVDKQRKSCTTPKVKWNESSLKKYLQSIHETSKYGTLWSSNKVKIALRNESHFNFEKQNW